MKHKTGYIVASYKKKRNKFAWCAELCVNGLLHNMNICKIVCIFS